MNQFTMNLLQHEAEIVLSGLKKLPWEVANDVIGKLISSFQEQMKQATASEPEAPPPPAEA